MAVELGEHAGLRRETRGREGEIAEVGTEAEDVMVARERVIEGGVGIEVVGWTDDGVMVYCDWRGLLRLLLLFLLLLLLLLFLGRGYVCVCAFVVPMRR